MTQPNWTKIFTAASTAARSQGLPFDFSCPEELAEAVGPRPTPQHRLYRRHSADGWTASNLYWTTKFNGIRRMNGFTWVVFGTPYPTLRAAAKANNHSESWIYTKMKDPLHRHHCYKIPNKQPGDSNLNSKPQKVLTYRKEGLIVRPSRQQGD